MVIMRIHINRFGALRERDIPLDAGLNIIEGENESGKTTVAAFLRYLFYGTDAASSDGGSEWLHDLTRADETDASAPPFGGYADISCYSLFDGTAAGEGTAGEEPVLRRFRVVRGETIGADGARREHCAVYAFADSQDACILPDTAHPLYEGAVPGEVFFGVDASVFSATAFVAQPAHLPGSDGSGLEVSVSEDSLQEGDGDACDEHASVYKTNAIRAAMDRILHAADEMLDPDGAIAILTRKRRALYDPETGSGSIADLERRRDAMEAASQAASEAAAQPKVAQPEAEQPQTAQFAADGGMALDSESQAMLASLEKSIVEFEENKRAKEARTEKLRTVYDAYTEYVSYRDADLIPALTTQGEAADKRADALTKTMFRGDYVPDADFAASLHLCASDLKAAQESLSSAQKEEEKLAFAIRRDNFKENRLRRVSLDGGPDTVLAHLDKLRSHRSTVTVAGILFMLLTIFMLAFTIVFPMIRSVSVLNLILITAVLGAASGFFFSIRGRHEKGIAVMLARYDCSTEDELDNFLEEFRLAEQKLQTLDESKEALRTKMSDASLRASEAGRQAALLLSKLQPPGMQKLTADRLNADIIESAANRIDRTLAEIARQREQAAQCRAEVSEILCAHGAESYEAILARRDALDGQFGFGETEDYDTEPLLREMDFNIKACAAIDLRLEKLRAKRDAILEHQSICSTIPASESGGNASLDSGSWIPASAGSADCPPDPAWISGMLAQMDEQLRRERKQYAAYTLAISMLKQASDGIHASLAPRLTENAGRLMRLLTGERWNALILDDEMRPVSAAFGGGASDSSAVLPVERLSAGTQELAYFSLRLALLQMLYKKELPPMIFDEAFSTLDDKRLARMIALLLRLSAGRTGQAILFTCHKRERRAAEAIGRCHVVRLTPTDTQDITR